MNRLFLGLVLLTAACTTVNYQAPDLGERTADHRTVAVLPFEMIFTGKAPPGLGGEQILAIEEAESLAFQTSLYHRLLNQSSARRERPITIRIQPVEETNRILDVGQFSENNGNRILFIDSSSIDVSGDGALVNREDGKVRITKDGIVFERMASGQWSVKGYGGEYDVVCRDTGKRYAWTGKQYVAAEKVMAANEKAGAGKPAPEDVIPLETKAPEKHPLVTALRDLSRLSRANGSTQTLRLQRALCSK